MLLISLHKLVHIQDQWLLLLQNMLSPPQDLQFYAVEDIFPLYNTSDLTKQNFDKEYELRIDNILIEKTTYNITYN